MFNEELIALIPALVLFCFIAAFTPGPNNILLTLSGAKFGVKRTMPHIFGIRVGMTVMHILMLCGLGSLFSMLPILHAALQAIACGYILYLASKIIQSGAQVNSQELLQPMSVNQAAVFQLINPKSISMLLSLCSALTIPGALFWDSAILGLVVFNLVGICCAVFWVFAGKYINRYLHKPKQRSRFNIVMALLLVTCLPLIFI
ncbi:LysE family translocator [Pseudoalteromonas sp. MMG012]|uniref:LysE family translocator n=1 Tax=Pseudoalteromonas sp. MMG012 TaxID=2822686 RepID=UPI001B3A4E48|nr:LysE family translocator [Pseudoalteromonas sp. MMG012]MBQ4852750.1 LysE family translocator [Pseudoalteromonas sp. MMG012]